jgi:plastocyanin
MLELKAIGCFVRVACAALAIALCAGPAGAGVIRGQLRLSGPAVAAATVNAYPGRASSMAMAKAMEHGAVTDAVLWIERVPAAADTARGGTRPRLAQKDQCFSPRVLPVAVGTSVEFPNLDPIFHNVFSASPVKRFDLGKYPRGQSKRVSFDKPGLVNVYCDIHSGMEAFVLVLPTHVFAQPERGGRYALPPVPGGTYTLHVWHPDRGEFRREVQVPESGDLALDLES